MGQTTIEWNSTPMIDGSVLPGYTFDPWIGGKQISADCKTIYPENLDKRKGDDQRADLQHNLMSAFYWHTPIKWNKEASKRKVRRKVFCAGQADLFEDRQELIESRKVLFDLINETPCLDWLLITKVPENIPRLLPLQEMPFNVWLGTSVENQTEANQRIPLLLSVKASIHFLSMEPLLERVSLTHITNTNIWGMEEKNTKRQVETGSCLGRNSIFPTKVDWIIVGGEYGNQARPMHSEWVRSIRNDCKQTSTAFFFKHWGEWVDRENVADTALVSEFIANENLGNWSRTFAPSPDWIQIPNHFVRSYRLGINNTGCRLDGLTHHAFPSASLILEYLTDTP